MIGITSGGAFSGWSAVTMFWPLSYMVWDIGRSVVFVGFVLALVLLAIAVANAEASVARMVRSVTAAVLVSAVLTLGSYAVVTGFLAERIVQLPEYARDYSHHRSTSPAQYLGVNYWELLQLQVFSWFVGGVVIIGVASLVGWLLRGSRRLKAA